MAATWLADILRAAGCEVVEVAGWKTRGHGDFTSLEAVTWHHDASPPGDSPGVVRYMLDNWDTNGAQLWVDRAGRWHVLAAGVAYHAGQVLPGMPGNRQSLGVETDHTTGEPWPPAQLLSLRRGTAAILRHLRRGPEALHFHKTICSPVGRKTDPDGLDLERERAALLDQEDDDMAAFTDDHAAAIARADERTEYLTRAVAQLLGETAGLRQAVAAIAAGGDVTADEIEQAAQRGAKAALDERIADSRVELTAKETP